MEVLVCESASGMGVFSSLLGWLWPGSIDLVVVVVGGMYVCPYDDVNVGKVDAVFSILVRDVTAESCPSS